MDAACLRAVLLLSLALGGWAAQSRAESPVPRKPSEYLPVEDVPKRADPAMSADDRAKLVKELTAARDRQTLHAKPKEGAARPTAAKP
ncbi:MAG: hypothetical protein JOZ74_03360 [Bradyrhizobium sp.]|nr:hypothetical protein [Bradyrhizobium sp.]